jgi:hypothetical protein
MFHRLIHRTVSLAALLALFALSSHISSAFAAEARPWLCRDKPVFSTDKPANFVATAKGSRRWQIFFMQFQPGGTHDGFAITSAAQIPKGAAETTGSLASGRFFAVAMYLLGDGHWACSPHIEEGRGPRDPGTLRRLCYSDDDSGPCKLDVSFKASDHPASSE